MVQEVALRKRRIDAAFVRAGRLAESDELLELQAEFARHICVLISGFIERSIAELIVAYAEGKAPPQLRSYLESSLKRLSNVDKERLLRVMGELDATWREDLDEFVHDERLAAMNSVVGLRNEIAHGGGASVSLARVRGYWNAIVEVVDRVELLLFPTPRTIRPRRR